MTQMGIQRAAARPVGAKMLIHTFMRKRKIIMPKKPSTDLLGAPLKTQFAFNLTTPASRPFISPTFVTVSLLHLLVGGAGMVSIAAFVAAQLS